MTNENSTIVHEGITYRKANRRAHAGEKVIVTNSDFSFGYYNVGDVLTVTIAKVNGVDVIDSDDTVLYLTHGEYYVLEPAEQPQSDDSLTLTEADVRNNPRQVIDLLGNMALRLTQLESKVDRLASANEQAITAVARNVETWAQDYENLKYELAKVDERTQPYQVAHDIFVKIAGGLNGRNLTAEERREL
jgi:nucleoside-triphosphatase THEP1